MLLRISVAAIFATALLSGCSARSLNPVVGEQEAESIEELVGIWRADDGAQWPPAVDESVELDSLRIEVAPSDSRNAHAVVVTDADAVQDGPDQIELALQRTERGVVGHAATGEHSKTQNPDSFGGFHVQVYCPLLVQVTDDHQWMAVTLIDEEALESSFDEGNPPIACVRAGGTVLISAEPAAIREFLLTMPDQFQHEPMVFRREMDLP